MITKHPWFGPKRAQGGHAFGLRPTHFPIGNWPRLIDAWLDTIGMTSK